MIPRTPQKKSEEQEKKADLPNYSCILGSDPLRPHPKPEEGVFKNSQILVGKSGKGFAKKYAQQESIFKGKSNPSKEYREVVISDEFVRSHKLFKMLKEQISIADARHIRESAELNNNIKKQQNQTMEIRTHNYQIKLELWKLRNQLVELKALHKDEDDENKRLVEEYEFGNGEEEGEEEWEEGEGEGGEGDGGEEEEEEEEEMEIKLEMGEGGDGSFSKQEGLQQSGRDDGERQEIMIDDKGRGPGIVLQLLGEEQGGGRGLNHPNFHYLHGPREQEHPDQS